MCLNDTLAFACCAFNLVNKYLPLGMHPRVQAMTWIKYFVSSAKLNASLRSS